MMRALRRNRIVFVMIDQGVKHAKDGMPMRFLGKDMPMPMGPAQLARTTRRTGPAIDHPRRRSDPGISRSGRQCSAQRTQSWKTMCELLVRTTERQVLERPQLWSWHQRRWRKFRLAAPLPA